ncbi:hypothetical protein [Kitasatospora purpeofusca]|uniref:hypothetical protein n=1 Tax=Kitasatospora purpeofusca TaxID=67352 RepID=UPI0036D3ED11
MNIAASALHRMRAVLPTRETLVTMGRSPRKDLLARIPLAAPAVPACLPPPR